MVVVIFRSRLRPNIEREYLASSQRMLEIAESLPGFISVKGYTADDGEKVSIHEWESLEHLRAWREHPEHLETQEIGRREFFEEYSCYVCDEPRRYSFP